MNLLPDLAAYGYQVIRELGHNSQGGRFTYLAKRLADNVHVVIKQFQFAKGAGWDDFKAIEREIQSLQGLDHPGIPKYLDKFETDSGYCLVTEYFRADTLAVGRSFTPDQIKQIAVQILEILIYLQERIPPVIHRDIKPENILVDQNLNAYLIDFGFARVGSGSVAMSSVVSGTMGFMSPEQINNLRLNNSSDLYGLGVTLVCLIGAVHSNNIGEYVDLDTNQLDQGKITPKLKGCSQIFINWLFKMAAPPSKRFADAKTALAALNPLYVVRVPEVKFDKSVLKFKSTKQGEKITQVITISNTIPETVLEGNLEIAPHLDDPPHTPDGHTWISISRSKIWGNHTECCITVDTSNLPTKFQGRRELVFTGNAESVSVTIQVETLTPRSVRITEQQGVTLSRSDWQGFFVSMVVSLGATLILWQATNQIYFAALLFTYLFLSFALMKIGDKAGVPNAWLAWIPVVNLWVMCRAAGKPGWWLLLFFVPLVNTVIAFMVIFGMPGQLGKSSLLGLLVFVPVIGIFLYYGILAFT